MSSGAEQQRLDAARADATPWKRWGPYLSERQWGTVREDYSDNGDAWNYFTHDQARSRAYRWGEDGLGGISDDHQVLCFALAARRPKLLALTGYGREDDRTAALKAGFDGHLAKPVDPRRLLQIVADEAPVFTTSRQSG